MSLKPRTFNSPYNAKMLNASSSTIINFLSLVGLILWVLFVYGLLNRLPGSSAKFMLIFGILLICISILVSEKFDSLLLLGFSLLFHKNY